MRKFHKRYDFIIKCLLKFSSFKNKTIVDCACGEGDGTRMFAQYAKYLIGIDSDAKKIKKAKKEIKGIRFIVSSISSLALRNSMADIFICSETLEHLSSFESHLACEEIERVCKFGCFLCITVT